MTMPWEMNNPYYEIQATCKHGCDQHSPGEWRKSRRLHAVTKLEEAVRLLNEHAKEHPGSAPYRLVMIRPAYMIPEAAIVVKEVSAPDER